MQQAFHKFRANSRFCSDALELQHDYQAQSNLGSSYLMRETTSRHSLRGGTTLQECVLEPKRERARPTI
jgi:hypothetical protein